MSEPQLKKDHKEPEATSPGVEEIIRGEEEEPTTTTAASAPVATEQEERPALTGDIKTLKDAFPDLDVEVIETILHSQGGNLDAAFEVLLGMSDPSYKPEPAQQEGLSQLRQDEEYARQLAREGDAHHPQNNNNNTNQQNEPLFNFQEELPIIKEKVIEVGTAAKNKIVNLYNQFMAATADNNNQQSSSSSGAGVLETGMGNLSLSENQPPRQPQRPSNTPKRSSVDLYEWDGNRQEPIRNPLNQQHRKNSSTSTPTEQMLADEEFARQLAREDAEAAAAVAAVNESTRNSTAASATNNSIIPKATEENTDSDNGEVSFSALSEDNKQPLTNDKTTKSTGYTIQDDDDLDDLFDKNDEEESKSVTKK